MTDFPLLFHLLKILIRREVKDRQEGSETLELHCSLGFWAHIPKRRSMCVYQISVHCLASPFGAFPLSFALL